MSLNKVCAGVLSHDRQAAGVGVQDLVSPQGKGQVQRDANAPDERSAHSSATGNAAGKRAFGKSPDDGSSAVTAMVEWKRSEIPLDCGWV